MSTANGLHITTTSLTPGEKGVAYKVKLAATGGTAPYTWSLKTGPMPPGLTLSSNGKIAGTPTKKGTYTLTFKVADSASPKGKATATLTLHIEPLVEVSKTEARRYRLRSAGGLLQFRRRRRFRTRASAGGR